MGHYLSEVRKVKKEERRLHMLYKDRPIDLRALHKEKDWVEIEATALSNNLRWGGLQDNATSVARHCVNVASVVLDMTRDPLLAYNALHHEIEETFTGDIPYDIKHYIFSKDKTMYNGFKDLLTDQLGLHLTHEPIIKTADILVGILEAREFNTGYVENELYQNHDKEEVFRMIERYKDMVDLNPQDKMKDRKDFILMNTFLEEQIHMGEGYERV